MTITADTANVSAARRGAMPLLMRCIMTIEVARDPHGQPLMGTRRSRHKLDVEFFSSRTERVQIA